MTTEEAINQLEMMLKDCMEKVQRGKDVETSLDAIASIKRKINAIKCDELYERYGVCPYKTKQ